jgi:hypothetical protein
LAEFNGDIPDLQVRRPSLEEAYLQMITAAAPTNPPEHEHGEEAR